MKETYGDQAHISRFFFFSEEKNWKAVTGLMSSVAPFPRENWPPATSAFWQEGGTHFIRSFDRHFSLFEFLATSMLSEKSVFLDSYCFQ